MTDSPTRAAIYLRVSLDREMDGLAIDRQHDGCRKIAADREWAVVGTYIDQSRSATDKSKTRPDYDRMITDYRAGLFDAIVCWDLDRLTRQPRQLEDWIDEAELRGLRLVTANGEADLTNDGGRLYARVKAAVARGEVERSAERRSAAELQRARRGLAPKGLRLLGYSTSAEVIAHEAEAVRELFRLSALPDGPSISSMVAALSGQEGKGAPLAIPRLPKRSRALAIERNQRRIAAGLKPTEVPDDGPWALSTVLGVLRNPRYAGYSVYTGSARRIGSARSASERIVRNEDGTPVLGNWKPLIDQVTWNTVQARLNRQSITARPELAMRHRYLGSGIYLCGLCGRPLTARSGRYRCGDASGEKRHLIRSYEGIDNLVLSVVRELLTSHDLDAHLLTPSAPRVSTLAVEIANHRASVRRVVRDFGGGHVTGSDVARIRGGKVRVIADLEEERRCLLRAVGLGNLINCDDPRAMFDGSSLDFQRLVVDSLVEIQVFQQRPGRRGVDPSTVRVLPRAELLEQSVGRLKC